MNMLEILLINNKESDTNKYLWSALPALPGDIRYQGVVGVGDRIYMACGERSYPIGNSYSTNFENYQISTGSLTALLSPSIARRIKPQLVLIGTKIYLFGGYDSSIAYRDLWEYNTANSTWRTALRPLSANTTVDRFSSICVNNGFIYALYSGSNTTGLSRFDPGTNTWVAMATLRGVNLNSGVWCSIGTDIFHIGGRNNTSVTTLIYKYNTITNVWTTSTEILPVPLTEITGCTKDGIIYLYGSNNTLYKFDGTVITLVPNKNSLPGFVSSTQLVAGNGGLYLMGGDLNNKSRSGVYKFSL